MYQDKTDSIETLFQNKILQVPDYQRGYAWEEEHWDDLLEDLELLPEGRDHYTGTVVLHVPQETPQKHDQVGQKYDVLHIVDGQQRLTTIILLLDAIRREMAGIPELQPTADRLLETYIRVLARNKQDLPKLRLNRDCHTFYYEGVLGQGKYTKGPTINSHTRLSGAHAHFAGYLREQRQQLGGDYLAWLDDLTHKIRHRLRVLVHYINHEADAGVIFETMNNRGKAITELEKAKNYLLYVARKLDVDQDSIATLTKKINQTWTNIFESLMRYGLEDSSHENRLLRTHWIIAYDANRRNWSGSNSIKDRFHLRSDRYREDHERLFEDLNEYLDTLDSCIIPYCDVYRPTHPNAFNAFAARPDDRRTAVRMSRKLERLGVIATFVPLLVAIRVQEPTDVSVYARAVELCEKFAFRVYRLAGWQPRAARTKFERFGRRVFQGREAEAVLDSVRSELLNYCSDAEFQNSFELHPEENNWYQRRGLRYLLYEYEEYLAEKDGVPPEDIGVKWSQVTGEKAKTVEHILPQTSDSAGYWRERFDATLFRKYVHDLGNLSLCLPEENSWLSNKTFVEKKGNPGEPEKRPRGYVNSSFHMQRRLAGYVDWNEEALLKRRQQIVDWALERWKVTPPPPPPTGQSKRLQQRAEENGVGEAFNALYKWAKQHPRFYIKHNKRSIEVRPWGHRYTVLTIRPRPGRVSTKVWVNRFPRLLPIDEARTVEIIGGNWRREITNENVNTLITQLDQLFTAAKGKEEDG